MDRERIFNGKEYSDYLYCIHCERAYKYGSFREIKDLNFKSTVLQLCPYDDCEGDTVLDAKDWKDIREHHPDYPEIPELGKVYPLN